MNGRSLVCIAGFGLVSLLAWTLGRAGVLTATHADERQATERAERRPCGVAMIDVTRVFKEHIELKKAMDRLGEQ